MGLLAGCKIVDGVCNMENMEKHYLKDWCKAGGSGSERSSGGPVYSGKSIGGNKKFMV